jgi:DNA-binding protein HU-beta
MRRRRRGSTATSRTNTHRPNVDTSKSEEPSSVRRGGGAAKVVEMRPAQSASSPPAVAPSSSTSPTRHSAVTRAASSAARARHTLPSPPATSPAARSAWFRAASQSPRTSASSYATLGPSRRSHASRRCPSAAARSSSEGVASSRAATSARRAARRSPARSRASTSSKASMARRSRFIAGPRMFLRECAFAVQRRAPRDPPKGLDRRGEGEPHRRGRTHSSYTGSTTSQARLPPPRGRVRGRSTRPRRHPFPGLLGLRRLAGASVQDGNWSPASLLIMNRAILNSAYMPAPAGCTSCLSRDPTGNPPVRARPSGSARDRREVQPAAGEHLQAAQASPLSPGTVGKPISSSSRPECPSAGRHG